MSQATTWGVPRNATEGDLSEAAWAARADDSFDAILSGHKGGTAPSYAVAGTEWLDDSGTPWLKKVYDGVDWITVEKVNASTNKVSFDSAVVDDSGGLIDGDFGTAGLMKTDGAGAYSIVTDNSTNWNTAHGWGNHASAGYLTAVPDDSITMAKMAHQPAGAMMRWGALAAPELFGIGVEGQVLTVFGGLPNWQPLPASAGSDLEFIATADLTTVNVVLFTGFNASIYDGYLFMFQNARTSVDANIGMRTSTNGGVSYATGGSDYTYVVNYDPSTGTVTPDRGTGSSIILATNVGDAAFETGFSGHLWLPGPHLARNTHSIGLFTYHEGTGALRLARAAGMRNENADVNAVQFFTNVGTWQDGTITMYGLRNS